MINGSFENLNQKSKQVAAEQKSLIKNASQPRSPWAPFNQNNGSGDPNANTGTASLLGSSPSTFPKFTVDLRHEMPPRVKKTPAKRAWDKNTSRRQGSTAAAPTGSPFVNDRENIPPPTSTPNKVLLSWTKGSSSSTFTPGKRPRDNGRENFLPPTLRKSKFWPAGDESEEEMDCDESDGEMDRPPATKRVKRA